MLFCRTESRTVIQLRFRVAKGSVVKRLLIAPHVETNLDATVEFFDHVSRLVAVTEAAGYRVSRDVAAALWVRYSNSMGAGWMSIADVDDTQLVRCLLNSAAAVDELDEAPSPPSGYASWLDYVVENVDTLGPELARLFPDGNAPRPEVIRAALRNELDVLRQHARLVSAG